MEIAFGPLNLSPAEFWDMTPAEIYRLVDGWTWRDTHEKERVAWQTALLLNVQLKQEDRVTVDMLMGLEELPTEQTEDDKLDEMEKLNAILAERRMNAANP